ncbi:MAG: copper chaperone PCu(A)C [Proteobacteria bacterium]|nr:copper chaperone PCu(A)C [Pseudomonadota bacterium]
MSKWRPAVALLFALAGIPTAAANTSPGGPWSLGDIVVEQAWARLLPGDERKAAVYLTVHNKSGDEELLIAVDSPAAGATSVNEDTSADGEKNERPLPFGLPLPAHGEVVMKPGGFHILLSGISRAVDEATALPVTMVFRDAGTVDFDVPIIPEGEAAPKQLHSGHSG